MAAGITRVSSCYYHHLILKNKNGLSASVAVSTSFKKMVTNAASATITASSSINHGEYRSIAERVSLEKEIKKSKFIAIAAPISDEESAFSFLSEVRDPRATHNCWAFKVGQHSRCNDDGEPSGTAGKPIQSAILSSHIDRVMVVVIRYHNIIPFFFFLFPLSYYNPFPILIEYDDFNEYYIHKFSYFGGIKLGTGGLVRAYGGVTSECLRNAPTCLVKSKVSFCFSLISHFNFQHQSPLLNFFL
jgi:putative IMPACT (imprinted ancient) family translation regulator